ncbi:MAG: LamB/YcsF family protein [Sulfobacillus acidophilus]|uniref:5-oxoprolinase subunit A n=1 Tax=Sulfobacillus acidophilus TaxID=53633 RepID=A0A2T2WLP6_9FIRM|nr:MAG: LamB/YcsF family protein [Sulfobacillus acidophilus]
MPNQVDLNCDMGESYGAWRMGNDEEVMPHISSANIACGFHGGDPLTMARTVQKAREYGVACGAHPSFPDLVGFGRRNLDVTPEQARTDVLYQIGALSGFCRRFGVALQHVKPHGQLNNLAMTNRPLADAIIAAIRDFDPNLIVVAYGGELARAAQAQGMRVAYEVFADREYNPDGTLVSRRVPGAVITDDGRVIDRAVRMVREGQVTAVDGTRLTLPVHTVCIHGDTPGAARLVAKLREAFRHAEIAVTAMDNIVK